VPVLVGSAKLSWVGEAHLCLCGQSSDLVKTSHENGAELTSFVAELRLCQSDNICVDTFLGHL
jgi:hypothetical protein